MRTWKRAQNMQVVTLEEGADVGRLDDFQFDLATHTIYGWRVKGVGMFAKAGGVPAAELVKVGRDVAFLRSEVAIEWSGGKPRAVEGRAWASTYRGTQALSRIGRGLGAVQDYVLDDTGSRVTGIILHGGLLLPLDGRVRLGAAAVIAESPDVAVQLPGEGEEERTDWWVRIKSSLAEKDESSEEQ